MLSDFVYWCHQRIIIFPLIGPLFGMMFWIIRLTGEDAGTLLPEGLEFGRRLCAGTTLSIGRQGIDLDAPCMNDV